MEHSYTKPSKLDTWGDSLLNKLPGVSRQRRKREASKRRRAMFRREDRADTGQPL